MTTTNSIVANAMAAHGKVAKNALTVEEQRQNDADWKKFETEAGKVLADGAVIKKELKEAENMVAACYAKIKPIFDKAVKFGRDKEKFCFGIEGVSSNLLEEDRYKQRVKEAIIRMRKEVVEGVLHQGDAAQRKAYDIINLPRPFYN